MSESTTGSGGRLARMGRWFADLAEAAEMTEAGMLEQRVATLEAEVRVLRAQVGGSTPIEVASADGPRARH